MPTTSEIHRIAFLGDYPPRKCGIATFTSDLLTAVAAELPQCQCFAVPVNDCEGGYDYPEVVRFEVEEQDLSSYQRAADFLNISNVDIVCLQHEFGIFGGPVGSHLLALLRELKMPVVTTHHTVQREPNSEQRCVMQEWIGRSTRLVVMADRGRQMLQDIYQASPGKIDLIPHGIPNIPFVDPNYYKDQFGVEGKQVLLTFGLISPAKGIEYVIRALPEVVKVFPEIVYIVLGATHPHLLREQGETYRLSRIAQALGYTNSLRAVRFLGDLLRSEEQEVQKSAVDALVKLNFPSVTPLLFHETMREQDLKRAAPLIDALEKLHTQDSTAKLMLIASNHQNLGARSRATKAISRLDSREGAIILVEQLESTDTYIHSNATDFLRKYLEEKSEIILGLLSSKNEQIRQTLVKHIANISIPTSTKFLIKALSWLGKRGFLCNRFSG